MSDVEGAHVVEVAAPLAACLATLDDVERYPQWYDTIDAARLLDRAASGRPALVAFAVVAGPLGSVEFTLRFSYPSPADVVGDQVAGNGRVERVRTAWRLEPICEARTQVAYEFSADAASWAVRAALRVARPLVERDLIRLPPVALKRTLEARSGPHQP